jgi:hypothetical protein
MECRRTGRAILSSGVMNGLSSPGRWESSTDPVKVHRTGKCAAMIRGIPVEHLLTTLGRCAVSGHHPAQAGTGPGQRGIDHGEGKQSAIGTLVE